MAVNEYIQGEVSKILANKAWEFPLNHAMAASWIIANFKGENLKIFDMQKSTALCDYSIIATAQNATQARAMADEVAQNLKLAGARLVSFEGYDSADWVLIDTGDIFVHIFTAHNREIYDFDMLHAKTAQVQIPQEFYFGKPTEVTTEKPDLKGYF